MLFGVTEFVLVARGCDADVADAAALARAEVTQDVDASSYPTRPPVDRLVAESVGKPLHGVAGRDRVAVEMQLAMNLDQAHRPAVARQNCETA